MPPVSCLLLLCEALANRCPGFAGHEVTELIWEVSTLKLFRADNDEQFFEIYYENTPSFLVSKTIRHHKFIVAH
jgi:hypothetical protein